MGVCLVLLSMLSPAGGAGRAAGSEPPLDLRATWGAGAPPAWELGLAGPAGGGGWRLRVGAVGPGAVPVGGHAPAEWGGASGSVAWEAGSAAVEGAVASGRPYRGFAGPLRLVDGSVFGPASQVSRLGVQAGQLGAVLLHARSVPLWYTHNRLLVGQAWAVQVQAGASHLQAVVGDTGWQRLLFQQQPPIEARQVQAAVLAGARWRTPARGEWTARLGISQRARREDLDLGIQDGWAAWVRGRSPGRRPSWRLEAGVVSPAFDSPLWADDAPARDRVRFAGRWAWPRAGSRPGRSLEAELARQLDGTWVSGRLEAGLQQALAGGELELGAGGALAAQGQTWRPTGHLAFRRGAAGGSVELEPDGPCWQAWVGRGAWRLAAAAWPALSTWRVEWRWVPQEAARGWPAHGARLVAKWRAGSRPHLYAELAAPAGSGATLGLRVGRWDQGRPELYEADPGPLWVMVAWQGA